MPFIATNSIPLAMSLTKVIILLRSNLEEIEEERSDLFSRQGFSCFSRRNCETNFQCYVTHFPNFHNARIFQLHVHLNYSDDYAQMDYPGLEFKIKLKPKTMQFHANAQYMVVAFPKSLLDHHYFGKEQHYMYVNNWVHN